MGYEIGFLLGSMVDPSMLIGSLLIGIFVKSYSKVIFFAILYTIVIEVILLYVMSRLEIYHTIFVYRFIGTIIEASIFFGLKSIFKKKDKNTNELL
ncbi:hypothetical protein ACMAZA_02050 [Pseudothioglobus sp. nBUS_23]|uniref:hypothetical protein n=1 Tax=Pseudothioglobus sp. nBUS_23 TaxID=3395318 RepID=UPI003EB81D12